MDVFDLFGKISLDTSGFENALKTAIEGGKNFVASLEHMANISEDVQKGVSAMSEQYNKAAENVKKSTTETEKNADASNKAADSEKKLDDSVKKTTESTKQAEENTKKHTESISAQQIKLEVLRDNYEKSKEKVASLSQALHESAKETGSTSEATKKLLGELERAQRDVDGAKKAYENFSSELNDTADATKKLEKEIDSFGNNSNKILKSLPGILSDIGKTIGKISFKGLINGAETYAKGLKKAGQLTLELSEKTAKVFASDIVGHIKVASKAITAISGMIGGIAGYSIKVGMEFESSMSQVKAVSGATGEEFEKLKQKASEMGENTVFSASEAADAMNYMAMAGWKTDDMLNGIDGVLNLAAASGADLATTSDIVTDALTAMGYSAGDAGRLADVMAAASSNANTNVEMMGGTFKYVAPILGALNYTMEDGAVAIGLMANSGIKAEQAGTSLRSILTRMSAPADDVNEAMNTLGISITNADGSMKSLDEVMDNLRTSFAGLSETEKTQYASTIAGQEAMSGFLAIVNAAPADVDKLKDAIDNCDGAAAAMAETMQDNLSGALKMLRSKTEAFGNDFYEAIDTPLKEVVNSAGEYMSRLKEALLSGGFEGLAESLGDVLADAINMIAGYIPNVVNMAKTVINSFIDGMIENAPGIIETLSNILTSVIQGAGEILPKFYELITAAAPEIISAISTAAPQILEFISTFLSSQIHAISEILPQILPLIVDLVTSIGNTVSANAPIVLKAISNILNQAVNWIKQNGRLLIQSGMNMVQSIAQGLVNNLPSMINSIVSLITYIGEVINENLPMLLQMALEILTAITQGIMENLPMLAESALQIITTLAEFLSENLPQMIPAIVEIILEIVDTLTQPSTLSTLVDAAIAIIIGLADGIINSLPKLVERLPEIVDNIVTGIVDAVPKLLTAALEIIGKLGEYLIDPDNLKAILDAGINIIDSLIQGAKSIFKALGDLAVGLLDEIADNLNLDEAWEWGKELVINLIDGIEDAWDEWDDTIEDMGEKLYDFFHPEEKGSGHGGGVFHRGAVSISRASGLGSIPHYARGGIVDDPTLALIGEAGKEAVVPLENNTEWIDKIVEKLNKKPSASGFVVENLNVTVTGTEDMEIGRTIAEKISEALEELSISQNVAIGGTGWK